MRVLKWYAPTDQQEITDIALHYVFEVNQEQKNIQYLHPKILIL